MEEEIKPTPTDATSAPSLEVTPEPAPTPEPPTEPTAETPLAPPSEEAPPVEPSPEITTEPEEPSEPLGVPGETTTEPEEPSEPLGIPGETPKTPENNSPGILSMLLSNKGLIIAVIIVILVAIMGLRALIGMNSADQYQGFIKKVEQQTEELKQKNSGTTDIPQIETLPETAEDNSLEEAIPASTDLT